MTNNGSTPWTASLGFSERLSNIMSITTALQTYDRSGKDYGASARARELENEALQEATSKEDYELRCRKFISDLKPNLSLSDKEDTLLEEDEDAPGNQHATSIGPYHDARFYKTGVFSTVWKAGAAPLGDKAQGSSAVALKVTNPADMAPPHNSAREVRLLMLVTSKESCTIPLLDAVTEAGGRLTLVFPFMPYDLHSLLRRHPRSVTPALRHQVQMALFSALSHIHAHNLIHRDVKPSNLLLRTLNGPIYLSDFGIAWSPTDPESEPPTSKITEVGTTCYRPPELLFGDTTYDQSLDMWAAGCVVAELEHPEHRSLFEPGPVGSELGLIKSIFETLGTPNETTWPATKRLPDWGKMAFREYPAKPWDEILAGSSNEAISLVSKLVRYEMSERISAKEALDLLSKREQ